LLESPNPKKSETRAPANSASPGPKLGLFKESEFDLGSITGNQSKGRPQPATDRAYKSELDSDMQELKRKFMGKDKQKKEPNKDVMFNKTFAAIPSRKVKGESTVEYEEMRMLVKMSFEKKKTNYEMLKEWDRRRAEALALHGRIIELLQN
jgi:hypothetical protein